MEQNVNIPPFELTFFGNNDRVTLKGKGGWSHEGYNSSPGEYYNRKL